MTQTYKIVLASASPRRKELLEQANYSFEIIPSHKSEIITKSIPSEVVMELACQKAEDVFQSISQDSSFIVIGADTVVAYADQILGKPKDSAHATRMLRMLSGKTHQVYTGVSLIYFEHKTSQIKEHSFYEKTDVTFYDMTDAEIASYVATDDPLDKAGAYGIQGPCAIYIKEINGDYNNVVGLPIARLYHEINRMLSE